MADLCLLFVGRPVKCFVRHADDDGTQLGYDTSTAARVVIPDRFESNPHARRFVAWTDPRHGRRQLAVVHADR